jgi:hypothetical protein
MAKLRHLQAIASLLGLELLLAPQALLALKVQLALQVMESLHQEPQTKKSAPQRLARKLPPPKQA